MPYDKSFGQDCWILVLFFIVCLWALISSQRLNFPIVTDQYSVISPHCSSVTHDHVLWLLPDIVFAHSSFRPVMHGYKVFWLQSHQKTLIITLLRQLKPAVCICLTLLHNIEQYSLMMIQYCQWKMKTIQFIVTCSTVGLCKRYGLN